jgi:hypothetical protein
MIQFSSKSASRLNTCNNTCMSTQCAYGTAFWQSELGSTVPGCPGSAHRWPCGGPRCHSTVACAAPRCWSFPESHLPGNGLQL